jgi:hypothetical protein
VQQSARPSTSGETGMTIAEIHRRLRYLPAVDNATYAWWWKREEKSSSLPPESENFDLESALRQRISHRVYALLHNGVLVSLGNRGRAGTRYIAGRPPQMYQAKYEKQTDWGYYDADPVTDQEASRRHFAKVGWRDRVNTELNRSRARTSQVRALLEEAQRLMFD